MHIESIQNGRGGGPVAIFARAALRAASVVYQAVVWYRNRRYDRGRTSIFRADVPVVCVGNLTTGGTGKSPIVCHLAGWLRDRHVRVAVISRGYRGDGSGINDEAREMAQRLPDVPQVQNVDRSAAAMVATEELEAEFLLMDDGFQHRRLHRDLDIVVIDATNPFGFGYLLPRGLLREPISGLRRAGVVLISRCDQVSDDDAAMIEERIRQHVAPEAPILRCRHAAKSLLDSGGTSRSIAWLHGKRFVTVCGIGNPAAFQRTVQNSGGTCIDSLCLPDHDDFDPEAMASVTRFASKHAGVVDAVLCTHKDLVKIRSDRIAGKPLLAVMIEVDFLTDPSPLHDRLSELIEHANQTG